MMDRFRKTSLARQVIEEIMYRYAEGIDTADIETVGDIFAAGALVHADGSETRGPKAITELFSSQIIFYDAAGEPTPYNRKNCSPRTRHLVNNIIMEFNTEVTVANTRSYFTVYQTIAGVNQIIAGGRYLDRFEHDPYGWHLIERRLLIENRGDMSSHLKGNA